MHAHPIQSLEVNCYRIPTETPEEDGTFRWEATTLVLVNLKARDQAGLGYSYADESTGTLIRSTLAEVILGRNALDIAGALEAMRRRTRNLGGPGVVAMAISAVDVALWDLKAKILETSLLDLLGAARDRAEVYGSGGFTNFSDAELTEQLGGWAKNGFRAVKMKIGRDAPSDAKRVKVAREAIGNAELFVDANGAYSRKQALLQAERFADWGVTWFEEPVSSDDLSGLRLLRDRAPAGMEVAAGEYGYEAPYFRRMLESGAVDVLQADATRCGGITGFLRAATLAEAFSIPFSFHCAPSLHAAAACAAPTFRIGEYFYDHQRIEQMLFDGAAIPQEGALCPDRSRPGLGLEFKQVDATRYLL